MQLLNWKAVLETLPTTAPDLGLPGGSVRVQSSKPVAPGVAHVTSATSQAPLLGRPGPPPSKQQGKAILGPVSGEFAGQERRQDLQAGLWAVTGPPGTRLVGRGVALGTCQRTHPLPGEAIAEQVCGSERRLTGHGASSWACGETRVSGGGGERPQCRWREAGATPRGQDSGGSGWDVVRRFLGRSPGCRVGDGGTGGWRQDLPGRQHLSGKDGSH